MEEGARGASAPRRAARAWRRVGALAVVLALAGVAAGAWLKVARRPPDVVLIVGDCLRADRVGPGPRGSLTPFLDELAAQGVRFTRAYAASSWTLPSIASLMTSRYPSQHGVNTYDARLRDEEETIGERLRDAGYTALGFSANFRLDESLGFGQGYFHWFPYVSAEGDPLAKPRAPKLAGDAIEIIDALASSLRRRFWPRSPYFLYFHFMEPHAPYAPPPGEAAGRGVSIDRARQIALNQALTSLAWSALGPPEVAQLAALYDAEVASLDAALRDLFAALARRGILERAIVVITADHGEEFREHGKLGHGFSLYDEVLRVPLLVRAPGAAPGAVIDAPVSLLDVAPTLLDLLGLAPEPRFLGRSRAAWLRRGEPAADDVVAELLPVGNAAHDLAGHRAALVRGSTKVLAHRDAAGQAAVREAYDLAADPLEQHPIRLDPRLGEALDRRVAELSSAAVAPQRQPLDAITRDRLRALGYAVDGD